MPKGGARHTPETMIRKGLDYLAIEGRVARQELLAGQIPADLIAARLLKLAAECEDLARDCSKHLRLVAWNDAIVPAKSEADVHLVPPSLPPAQAQRVAA